MKTTLQLLTSLILIALASCQSNTDNKPDTQTPAKIAQEDSLEIGPSKKCIYRGFRYHSIYEEDDAPGNQIENFNPDTIKKYGFKYLEIRSGLYGVTHRHAFDTSGRIIHSIQTGNSPFYPSMTSTNAYTVTREFIPKDSTYVRGVYSKSRSYPLKKLSTLKDVDTASAINRKALAFQWPIGTQLTPTENGWVRRSYIDSSLVYEGVVTVSKNCDTMVLKDYRMGNINVPFGKKLTHYYTEHFIFENDLLKAYTFIATEEANAITDHKWPEMLQDEFTYYPNGLRKSVVHKLIRNGKELKETIYYSYSKELR